MPIKFTLKSEFPYSEREHLKTLIMEWLHDHGTPKHNIYSGPTDVELEFADTRQYPRFRNTWTGPAWD